MRKNKRSQIWVETIIYTLIGLAIIGIVLTIIIPRIEKMKDRLIVEQTISALNLFNSEILDIEQASSGNKRIADFRISKGKMEINATNDSILYVLEDSKLEMSEPGSEIPFHKEGITINLKTEKTGAKYRISLKSTYNYINLTYDGKEQAKTLHASSTPYKISLENAGVANDKTNIDLNVV